MLLLLWMHRWMYMLAAPDFRKAIADLKAQGIDLPEIDFSTVLQHPVTVFHDQNNKKAPIIIYIVPLKEDGFDPHFDPAVEFGTTYNTVKFTYKRPEIDKLVGLIHYSIAAHKDSIIEAIKSKLT